MAFKMNRGSAFPKNSAKKSSGLPYKSKKPSMAKLTDILVKKPGEEAEHEFEYNPYTGTKEFVPTEGYENIGAYSQKAKEIEAQNYMFKVQAGKMEQQWMKDNPLASEEEWHSYTQSLGTEANPVTDAEGNILAHRDIVYTGKDIIHDPNLGERKIETYIEGQGDPRTSWTRRGQKSGTPKKKSPTPKGIGKYAKKAKGSRGYTMKKNK